MNKSRALAEVAGLLNVPQEVPGLRTPSAISSAGPSADFRTRPHRTLLAKNEEFYRRSGVIRYLRLSAGTGAAPPI